MNDKNTTLKLLAIVKKQQAMIERLANWSGAVSPASVLQANTPNSAGSMAGAPESAKQRIQAMIIPMKLEIIDLEWGTLPKIVLQGQKVDYPRPHADQDLVARLKPRLSTIMDDYQKHGIVLSIQLV
jgi:hypothetical protein